jgi:p-aminobenzoyl-glutamate transporter AbgT
MYENLFWVIHLSLMMEIANLSVTQANHDIKMKIAELLWHHEDFHQLFVHFVDYLIKFCHLYWLYCFKWEKR